MADQATIRQIAERNVALLAMKPARGLLSCTARARLGDGLSCEITEGPWRLVRQDKVQAASGGPGPKLREGDRQVPEGRYRITFLNPNSRFHVSLRLDYPNAEDRSQARREGRVDLGGDIMIHGSNVSIGCLAMGDEVAEDLFVLAALIGIAKVEAIISPTDLRIAPPPAEATAARPWVGALYGRIRTLLEELPPA